MPCFLVSFSVVIYSYHNKILFLQIYALKSQQVKLLITPFALRKQSHLKSDETFYVQNHFDLNFFPKSIISQSLIFIPILIIFKLCLLFP